jgi:hypothetical protein
MRMEWPAEELMASWTLVGEDWSLVGNKTGATGLGFAVLLKFFEIEAWFPRSAGEVPPSAVTYLAEQLKVDPPAPTGYDWSGRTIKYHREQVRAAFGFREFTRGDEDKLAGWLAEEVCPVELREEQLREVLLVRCRTERIEPPGRIDRIVGSAGAAFEEPAPRDRDEPCLRIARWIVRPGFQRPNRGVLRGVLGRREVGPAPDEDTDHRGHQLPQQRLVHAVTVGESARNGRTSSHS